MSVKNTASKSDPAGIIPGTQNKQKLKTGAGANISKKGGGPDIINNSIAKAITTTANSGGGISQDKVEAKSKIQQGGIKNKKEGFTNLNYAPVSASGPKASCPDPLKPYQNYKCGPINVNNFFAGIEFKPECCGNPAGSSYSNSDGCACLCPEQWTYLNSRGGNRTFPTEF